jgi:transposase
MALICGNREQINFLPKSIEEYVGEADPVRVYDAFVEQLDFTKLNIRISLNNSGHPLYDPKAMLKLVLYGYSYGIRSSRKLERATYHNLSFIWLTGGLKPDHKTISRFRKNNLVTIKDLLKQCAKLCFELNLIEGNTLFVDGSKIRGNASIKNTWTKEKCERALEHIDENIKAILKECQKEDKKEKEQGSYVKLQGELKDKKKMKQKVKEIMEKLSTKNLKSINTVDKECTRINSIHGSHAGYNAQIVVDKKHGLIVNSDVVSENNDLNQFATQINQANEILEGKCKTACADSGYASTTELEKIDSQDIKVVVPSQRQVSNTEVKEFDKENFKYDEKNDCYICPEGKKLTFKWADKSNKVYRITSATICQTCQHFGLCTESKGGRTIHRLSNEEAKRRLEIQYEKKSLQKIYRLRQQKVELPFGHIKRNLGVSSFLVRGKEGAKAEMSLLSSCFNIRRMMTIVGIHKLIKKLNEKTLRKVA